MRYIHLGECHSEVKHGTWAAARFVPGMAEEPHYGQRYPRILMEASTGNHRHGHGLGSSMGWDGLGPKFSPMKWVGLGWVYSCAWPAEGRSVLHIERSWPAIQAAPTDRPVSSWVGLGLVARNNFFTTIIIPLRKSLTVIYCHSLHHEFFPQLPLGVAFYLLIGFW